MTDPFAAALDALFQAPGSAAAFYFPADGQPRPIRVILTRPDRTDAFGGGSYVQTATSIEVRKSDIASPLENEIVGIESALVDGQPGGGTLYRIGSDEPMGDTEGLTWTVTVEPHQL